MGGLAALIFGDSIFRAMNLATPSIIVSMRTNVMPAFVGFMVLGSVSQNMLSTGAFEVYYNDNLVFSKIQTRRWPTMTELDDLLQRKGLRKFR